VGGLDASVSRKPRPVSQVVRCICGQSLAITRTFFERDEDRGGHNHHRRGQNNHQQPAIDHLKCENEYKVMSREQGR